MHPAIGKVPPLSPQALKRFERREQLLDKKELTPSERQELDKLWGEFDETTESPWDIIGCGCSWYCGGGPYKIISSSELSPQGNNTYGAENAHDLSFKYAWAEGVEGYGRGEYLEYYFTNDSPRITDVKIYNGYVKNDKAWRENSRVKKLEMSVNGHVYAILNLQDTKACQTFTFKPLGRSPDKQDLIVRFTILDVYKGEKYDDTVITEIFFDGTDVH